MDPQLRKTSTILDWLSSSLTTEQIQGLLDGHLSDSDLFPPVATQPRSVWVGIDMWRENRDLLLEQCCSIDHIIPRSRGGLNHPSNYFLMPCKVNNYFADRWTA